MSPSNEPAGQGDKQRLTALVGHLAALLRPYWFRLTLALMMLCILALVNLAIPATIGLLLNEVFPKSLWWLLWLILPVILVVYVLRNGLYLLSKLIVVYIGEHVTFQLRRRLFQRLGARNLQFYRDHNPGELSSRVMDDSFTVQSFVQDELLTLLQSMCLFVGLITVIYAVNWRLALVTTVVLPLHLVVFHYFKRPIRSTGHVAQEQLASVHGNLVEKFLGMEVVQGFTAEQRESESFVNTIDASRQAQLASKKLHVVQKIVADLLIGLGTVALLGFGGYQVMTEDGASMQHGTFIAFFGFVGMLYPTVAQLMGTLAKMVRAGASLERIEEVLAEPAQDQHAGEFRGPVRGHLSFFWVSVKRGDQTVLKDITLEIPAGTFCIITGPTGSGKSTLVNLVPRFIEPDHGRILIDTMDLGRTQLKRLRDSVGIAFQESFLFNATVMENLRYALPDATPEQVERVARITGADKLIEALPQGYETVLGEHGWNLSRGEKQKLALTRALLKDPGILILDEATSSIDVATEQSIIPRIQHFMRRRTTLMVTHRPDLFHHADMLVVLDAGSVVYQGPPTELPPDTLEELGILTPVLLQPGRRPEHGRQTVQLVTNGTSAEVP